MEPINHNQDGQPGGDVSPSHKVPVKMIYPSETGSPPPVVTEPNYNQVPQPVGPAPEPLESGWRRKWRSIVSTVGLLLLAPLIAWSVSAFALQSYQVDGQSMETTLQNRDRLIVDKLPRTIARITNHPYIPKRGDVIIFNARSLTDAYGEPKQLIKRVIGLPNERVVINKGRVAVYNTGSPSGFNPDSAGIYNLTYAKTEPRVDYSLKSDEIFVLGDNRPGSEDSRYFGPIKLEDIVGKLSLRIMPFNKFQHF